MLITERLYVPDDVDAGVLFGVNRENLILLRTLYPKLRLVAGDNVLKILGEASQIDDFVKVLDHLSAHIHYGSVHHPFVIIKNAQGSKLLTKVVNFFATIFFCDANQHHQTLRDLTD